jgi:hypothetical protein
MTDIVIKIIDFTFYFLTISNVINQIINHISNDRLKKLVKFG